MQKDPRTLEQEAYEFLGQQKFYDAFVLYQEAAKIYREQNKHKQAALCFASAATCWNKKSGENTFYNGAIAFEQAAAEALKVGDLEYASLLYRYAAINYERDRELLNYSECFYRSKECYRKFALLFLTNRQKIHPIMPSQESEGVKGAIRYFFIWCGLTFSYLIWGHGERPVRTFCFGFILITLSAFFYTQGQVVRGEAAFSPNFMEGLYLSLITFTTVGYGDITPLGYTKIIASVDALFGLVLMPLFLIGLTRKYLRE
ncbi:MAG: ion channel [Candidatus Omnitrophota bacterium]